MAPSHNFRKLEGKHVLVIGGSSGIGLAVAEAALEAGANVTVSSASPARIEAAASHLRSLPSARSVTGIACDLGSANTLEVNLESLFQAAEATTAGRINHVVYTAADALSLGSLETVTPEGILGAAHMRLVAPILAAKVAARHLERSAASSITLTTGTAAEAPAKGWSVVAYFAGGLQSLVKGLAVDLAPVRVNAVRPGVVADTALYNGMPAEAREALFRAVAAGVPVGKPGYVEDVAEAYIWLMKDANASGTVAGTDGGALVV